MILALLVAGCTSPALDVRDPAGSPDGGSSPQDTATTTPVATTGDTGSVVTTGSTGSTADTGTPPVIVDACSTAVPVCPGAPPTSSGQGLVALDRCAFALDRSASFDDLAPLVDGLETLAEAVTFADVAADLNREPVVVSTGSVPGDPPSVELAFRWEDEENNKTTWVPQGITGSPDADATGLYEGRRWVVASFYFDEDADPDADPKGVRLAFVDITDPADPHYRFVLLVSPEAGPNWSPIPIHAGGIAWVGDYLYVADTFNGLRVFDLRRIFRADTSEDVIGCDGVTCKAGLYAYAIPQVGAYDFSSPCTPAPRFSFVAVDRSVEPPRLGTGEYCSDTSCDDALGGRLTRFAIDPLTGLLASTGSGGSDRTWSSDAFYAGERQLQGGVSVDDTFLLSSSEPSGSGGALYRVDLAGRATVGWIDTPEDVMVDNVERQLFSLSEGLSERYVFAMDLDAAL